MKSHDEKQIHDWQEKVRHEYGDAGRLYHYLFETMNNFYYRYLETSEYKDLTTREIAPKTYGAISFESNMVDALKIKNPSARPGIMELAKSVPKAQRPMIRYILSAHVNELSAEHGELVITSEINWDFPHFENKEKSTSKKIKFNYNDLTQFRKMLAIKLEEASEIFL